MRKSEVTLVPAQVESPAPARTDRVFLDSVIEAAQRSPRSVTRAKEEAKALIGHDVTTAERSFYRLERTSRDGRKVIIEGPSVRLMEACAYAFRNIIVSSWVDQITDTHVIAKGRAIDLERVVAYETEVRRRITDRNGLRYSDDMITTTAQAACAIAKRNALSGVIPPLLVQDLYEYAKQVALKKAKPLAERITLAVQKFQKLGVKPEMLASKCGKSHVNELTNEDLENLLGTYNAICDGVSTVEEEFPELLSTQKPVQRIPEEEPKKKRGRPRKKKTENANGESEAASAIETPPSRLQLHPESPPSPTAESQKRNEPLWNELRRQWVKRRGESITNLREFLTSRGWYNPDQDPPVSDEICHELLENWDPFIHDYEVWRQSK